jgi:hypothetical protein
MRPSLRFFAAVCGATVLAVLLVLAVGYWAVQREPEFYRQALAHEPAKLEVASDQLLQHTTALASDVREVGKWQALFTDEQVNGWLAVDVPQNHSGLLPAEIIDPRVLFQPNRIKIGCRLEQAGITTVASLEVEVYMAKPNVLAIRFCKARAGAVPVPLAPILERCTAAVAGSNLRLEWQQSSGDPVALITLAARQEHGTEFFLECLELRDGAMYLAGRTERAGKEHDPSATPSSPSQITTQSASKPQNQR